MSIHGKQLAAALAVCVLISGASAAAAPPGANLPAGTKRVAGAPSGNGATVEFLGMCDASGAVVLDGDRFAVADDEDNVIRVYDGRTGGRPGYAVDVGGALGLANRTKELDLEAATRTSTLAFWLTSHGRSSKGKVQPNRLRFFATTVPVRGKPLQVVGQPYTRLLDDLLAAPALRGFDLASAAALPPKAPGGLNLEGMTAMPEGGVVIGFRNPVPRGRAIVIPLRNPEQLVRGARAQFGQPQLLDLGGRGIRSISYWHGRYLLIGGPAAGGGNSALYTWDGRSERPVPVPVRLDDLNPEGFASYEDRSQVLLLSDDGSRLLDGVECKKAAPERRRFRGRWVAVPK